MRILLQNYPCYVKTRNTDYEEYGETKKSPRPNLPIISGGLVSNGNLDVRVKVRMLLDTGAEITVVKNEKLSELENCLHMMLPTERKVCIHPLNPGAQSIIVPTFDLGVIFPPNEYYKTKMGFVMHDDEAFEFADMLVGQDILSQLVITFDGSRGTVTIIDPQN